MMMPMTAHMGAMEHIYLLITSWLIVRTQVYVNAISVVFILTVESQVITHRKQHGHWCFRLQNPFVAAEFSCSLLALQS